ncbi:hypothetical protein [Bradyrhizobium sp. JYMT SZCCT0428]|uniref:hypothetical protein n=1 Tax=Bradyrhizobium sp. JYMT SZCCT0428 TaxID=2807673 RepID=UPI0020127B2D|nr:hypothetical protein [Bradyrhizobium sp. JYMT SZCCT0428]
MMCRGDQSRKSVLAFEHQPRPINDLKSRTLLSDQADATGRRSRRPIFINFIFFLGGSNDGQWMGFQPKLACKAGGFEAASDPPIPFFAGAMQFAVMRPAQRYRKFVADLLAEPAGLCKTQMVWVTGLAAADKAGVASHKAQVLLVSLPLGLRQR